jgi:hypothetical protein
MKQCNRGKNQHFEKLLGQIGLEQEEYCRQQPAWLVGMLQGCAIDNASDALRQLCRAINVRTLVPRLSSSFGIGQRRAKLVTRGARKQPAKHFDATSRSLGSILAGIQRFAGALHKGSDHSRVAI